MTDARIRLISDLERYVPFNEQERMDREMILEYLKTRDNVFYRSSRDAHMTASAWVINQDGTKTLMAYHNLYDSWAWLGGHADGEEDLLKVALKEVREESGIQNVRAVTEDIYSLEILTVEGHEKKGNYVSSHLHLNVTFLLQADDHQSLFAKEDENRAVSWFSLEEAVSRSTEPWFQERIYRKLNRKLSERGICL